MTVETDLPEQEIQETRGRKMKYQTLEELETAIEEYKHNCISNGDCPGMAGLAYALKLDRRTLLNYSKNDLFFPTVEDARNWVEKEKERRGLKGEIPSSVYQFDMKVNHGYVDKIDINHSGTVTTPTINIKVYDTGVPLANDEKDVKE